MHYTQNEKLAQITQETLIVGIDIAKNKHVARAIDDRGFELGKRLMFTNDQEGFSRCSQWIETHQEKHQKAQVMAGIEPTGHYWLNVAYFLVPCGHTLVLVNPMHVKRLKEIDDNSPTKNDTKDAMVIAKQVKEGRYLIPNLLDGIYAELREGIKTRDQLLQAKGRVQGQIEDWLKRYFPEFTRVFRQWKGISAQISLQTFPLPEDVQKLTPETIVKVWKGQAKRHAGFSKAQKLL